MKIKDEREVNSGGGGDNDDGDEDGVRKSRDQIHGLCIPMENDDGQ